MKLKSWVLLLISSICFAFIGIINLFDKKYYTAIIFIVLAGIYVYLSISKYKTMNKSNEKSLSDAEIETMDNELKLLIADDKKIEAIKRYRVITGLGLLEAKEYVDLLSAKLQIKEISKAKE